METRLLCCELPRTVAVWHLIEDDFVPRLRVIKVLDRIITVCTMERQENSSLTTLAFSESVTKVFDTELLLHEHFVFS